jgi:hypothetical protein
MVLLIVLYLTTLYGSLHSINPEFNAFVFFKKLFPFRAGMEMVPLLL